MCKEDLYNQVNAEEKKVLMELTQLLGEEIPRIRKIESNSFGYMAENGNVLSLSLYHKSLSKLPKSLFKLTRLKILNLSHCKNLKCPISERWKRLEYIDLSYCNCENINEISLYLLYSVGNLKLVNLIGNPLSEKTIAKCRGKFLFIIEPSDIFPNKIYDDIIKNNIAKADALDRLINLIEFSNSNYIRAESINMFSKLAIKENIIFELVKNVLLSDEDQIVRAAAVLYIAKFYKDECADVLKYVIQNENGMKVIKTIFDSLGFLSIENSKTLLDEIFYKFNQIYKIKKEEIPFFIELDFKFMREFSFEFSDLFYYKCCTPILSKINDTYFNNESEWIAVRNRYVIGLQLRRYVNNFDYFKKIPKSFIYLSKLKYLCLSENKLKTVPRSIRYLHNLEELDLSSNELKTVPEFIGNMPSLKKLNLNMNPLESLPDSLFSLSKRALANKYISEGVNPDEAPVLGLIEMLVEKRLHNYETFLKYDGAKYPDKDYDKIDKYTTYFYYKLNKKGNITEIYGHPDGFPYYCCWYTIVPKQINLLKHLRVSQFNLNNDC
jgi:Leucine-rich repeat (LRR) protein